MLCSEIYSKRWLKVCFPSVNCPYNKLFNKICCKEKETSTDGPLMQSELVNWLIGEVGEVAEVAEVGEIGEDGEVNEVGEVGEVNEVGLLV